MSRKSNNKRGLIHRHQHRWCPLTPVISPSGSPIKRLMRCIRIDKISHDAFIDIPGNVTRPRIVRHCVTARIITVRGHYSNLGAARQMDRAVTTKRWSKLASRASPTFVVHMDRNARLAPVKNLQDVPCLVCGAALGRLVVVP